MLELKRASKYYYNKGSISSGFIKISLSFQLGEFVAITGESGSGKSTLLNVLSGLDSYEEGEMYVNGEETSHYNEIDYEIYRKKYIGNIFQNFNLINSYTVYQNIELVLLLNGYRKKDIKNKVLETIKSVDLYKYRNRKVSKLSGGQKQRVAIARVLAKDTPIIVADEPTGNLDSKSSKSILELLSKIAKDKLVIVVTHNYEQIEEYATRKITMHDGKVLEDKTLRSHDKISETSISNCKDTLFFNKIRLGIRNTFNIIPKFILLFITFLFVIVSFESAYASFKKAEYDSVSDMYNAYFSNTSDKRIIITKNDRSEITEDDYAKLNNMSSIEYIVKNDISLDNTVSLSNDDLFLYGTISNIDVLKEKITYGTLPKEENEVIISGTVDNWYIAEYKEKLLEGSYIIEELSSRETNNYYTIKIVGIIINKSSFVEWNDSVVIYGKNKLLSDYSNFINKRYSEIKYTFADKQRISGFNYIVDEILPSNLVPKGKVIVPESFIYNCNKQKCKNYKMNIETINFYYTDNIVLEYNNYYTKKNINKLTGYSFDKYNGAIFINTNDYHSLFNKGYFQSSVFLKDVKDKDILLGTLEAMGYKTLYIRDTLGNEYQEVSVFLKIFKVVGLTFLAIVLFFISYFVIKIILKSRNIYFATLRILGASAVSVKQLLSIELKTIYNMAYLLFIAFVLLIKNSVINLSSIKETIDYLSIFDYILIYLLIYAMTKLIVSRYSRKIFSSSAMKVYREEV